MLGYAKGKIIAKHAETLQCIVLMHRLGFEITLPRRLFDTLEVGQTAAFWLHTHVREDVLTLFGFANESEKHFFKQLLAVSGLGPKTALSLLGEHGAQRLVQLLQTKEVDEISQAPGVGKKLAQRLVLELSGKMEKWAWIQALTPSQEIKRSETFSPKKQLRDDLSSALLNLGYVPSQVKNTLDKLLEREAFENEGFEICLKTALRELSNRMPSERTTNG